MGEKLRGRNAPPPTQARMVSGYRASRYMYARGQDIGTGLHISRLPWRGATNTFAGNRVYPDVRGTRAQSPRSRSACSPGVLPARKFFCRKAGRGKVSMRVYVAGESFYFGDR